MPMKYVGGGFIRGVPARDLKDYEVAKYGIHYLLRSGLYVLEKPEPVQEPDVEQEEPATDETDEAPKRKRRSKKE